MHLLAIPSGLRSVFARSGYCLYLISLSTLVYSHPFGLLMASAWHLAGLIDRKLVLVACTAGRRSMSKRLRSFLPWLRYYLDHPPEFLSGPLSLRSLLGTPIGFVGGNFLVLIGLVILIARGIGRRSLVRDPWGRWQLSLTR